MCIRDSVYADPWNLRRSIDARDTSLLEDWFFNQGGRGAQPSRGTRPRNILVSAALIAVIGELYGDQFQCLVLAGGPEDWLALDPRVLTARQALGEGARTTRRRDGGRMGTTARKALAGRSRATTRETRRRGDDDAIGETDE